MPRIIVTSENPSQREPVVLFDERIRSTELSEGDDALRFIERLGWAISDAEDDSVAAARPLQRPSSPSRRTARVRYGGPQRRPARGQGARSAVASLLPRATA